MRSFEHLKPRLAHPAASTPDAKVTADAIVAAAKKARGQTVAFEAGPAPFQTTKATADGIITAAKKVRGEIDDPPEQMRADVAAIIAAGKKRRGEI